ncbi:MAG: WD40 repeat domain-containing protein [Zoogloeaceae bacterium]|nr:WD40 repeat domain-containing protein [Zoogloeaceae bacterium]
MRHQPKCDHVDNVAFSPDGRLVLLNSWDKIFILDAPTGTILRELKGGCNAIFSPDGRYVLARSGGNAMLWQVDTGQLRLQLEGATGRLAFSPDSSLVLSADAGTAENSVCLWEIASGRKRFEVREQKSSNPCPNVSSLAFSADGTRFFVSFRNEAACVWDVESDRELLRLAGDDVRAILSPNGQYVLTFHRLHKIAHLWDTITRQEVLRLQDETIRVGIDFAVFLPDGQRVIAGKYSRACIWDVTSYGNTEAPKIESRSSILKVESPDGEFIALSPDGSRMAFKVNHSRHRNGTYVLNTATGEELRHLGQTSWGEAGVFSPDGQNFLIGDSGGAVLWNIASDKSIWRFGNLADNVSSVAFSPDGARIASTTTFHNHGNPYAFYLCLWDAATGKECLRLEDKDAALNYPVKELAFSRDGRYLLTCSGVNVYICDAAGNDRKLRKLEIPKKFSALDFSPDGQQVLVGFEDNIIALLDVASGEEILRMEHAESLPPLREQRIHPEYLDITAERPEHINCVAFSPDGRHVLAGVEAWQANSRIHMELRGHGCMLHVRGSKIYSASLWDAATGKKILRLDGHRDKIHWFAFSPDARRILTASGDKTTRVWDAQTGKELFQLESERKIESVVFSEDGRFLIGNAEWDRVCPWRGYLWDAATGKLLRTLELEGTLAACSPDGKRLLTIRGAHFYLWDTETGAAHYRIHPYRDGWLVLYPDGRYRCGGIEHLVLTRNLEFRPVDAEFEAHWRLRD